MILYKSLLLNNIIFMKKYITLLFVFIFAITTFVSANYLSWYNLLWWSTIRITDMPDRWAYWAGYQVSNSSSNNYFVPTANTSEWNSFSSNRPSWVSICSIRNAWWNNWGWWTSCSRSCWGWIQYRYRSCTNPTASCGWSSCSWSSSQWQYCNTHTCSQRVCSSAWDCARKVQSYTQGFVWWRGFIPVPRPLREIDARTPSRALSNARRVCSYIGRTYASHTVRTHWTSCWSQYGLMNWAGSYFQHFQYWWICGRSVTVLQTVNCR